MSPYDDFVHVATGLGSQSQNVAGDYLENSKGLRGWTEGFMVDSLRRHHPEHRLVVTSFNRSNLIAFADAHDDVSYTPRGEAVTNRMFSPPARRYGNETGGTFVDQINFASYDYVFRGCQLLVYIVLGEEKFGNTTLNYILSEDLSARDGKQIDELIELSTKWGLELHKEVLVFNGGMWQKNAELWQNVQKSNWKDVILEKEKKETIIGDVVGFFDSEKKYEEFGVPWKRGVIFYGPPGNGKTISTKNLMHDLSKRTSPKIESLYVKSFVSFMGPEYSIRQIFLKARQMAPCLLIFEDIDSLVTPNVRSYFLNEVDGLESNNGIMMIASTNHLETLDPGIAKRPSRFDRKYLFDDPTRDERVQYSDYWRNKLKDNKKIYFPEELSERIADITQGFSFAYLKEAFIAALLVIANESDGKSLAGGEKDPLSDNLLWKEIQRQIKNLRKEMEEDLTKSAGNARLDLMSGLEASLPAISQQD